MRGAFNGLRSPFGRWHSSTSVLSIYAVLGLIPKLVLDFVRRDYITPAGTRTLAAATTHTRASNATMFDSDGLMKWAPHNLLTYSEDFTNSDWVVKVGIVTGVSDPSGGSLAATVTSDENNQIVLRHSNISETGPEYTNGVWIRRRTGAGTITITLPNNQQKDITSEVSNTWALVSAGDGEGYSFSSAYWIIRLITLGDSIDIAYPHMFRSDLGGMVNNPTTGDSYVPTTDAAVYLPRVGHHIYNGSAWANEGLLLESEARTNIYRNSSGIGGGVNNGSAAITLGGPLGSFLTISTDSGQVTSKFLRLSTVTMPTGSNIRESFFVKYTGWQWLQIDHNATSSDYGNIDILNGVVGTLASGITDVKLEPLGESWWRVSYLHDCAQSSQYPIIGMVSGATSVRREDVDTLGAGFGFTGISVEDTTKQASSYIPTSGATATRAAETLVVAAANMPTYTDAVSLALDGKVTYANTGAVQEVDFIEWDSDDNSNRIRLFIRSSGTSELTFEQRAGGTYDSVTKADNRYGIAVPFNLAGRYTSTAINGAVSGTSLTANTTVTEVADLSSTDFELGSKFNGTMKSLRVWPVDLTDVGIAAASAPTFTTEFAMTITTTGSDETFTIPCQDSGTFNAGIEWGDGVMSNVTAYNSSGLAHTYANAGDHLIRIRGSFPNIYFNNDGDRAKVKTIHNFGVVGWSRLDRAFYGCSNLTSFTAGKTDVSAVTATDRMFLECTGLTSLDLIGFNTAAVTDISFMFRDCTGLTSLDLSSFSTASVTDMSRMFRDCTGLTSLDLSSFNTAAVTDMSLMFRSCSSLTSIDVSSFNTAAARNISSMFHSCSSLTSIDFSSFNTADVRNMSNMFQSCSSLTSLDVRSFNTAAVTNMSSVFRGCSSLADVVGVEDFDIEGLNSTGGLSNFMVNVTLPTSRYDALLINWDAQDPFNNMAPDFGASKYTSGGTAAAARANLISTDGWTITDGGTA